MWATMNILFLGKKNDTNSQIAAAYTKQIFPQTVIHLGTREERFQFDTIEWWNGDYIFSYLFIHKLKLISSKLEQKVF